MNFYDVLAQAVGIVGMFFLICAFQFKESQKIFKCQFIASIIFIIHFWMLNALAGCIGLFINLLRSTMLLLQKKGLFLHRKWLYCLIVLASISSIVTWRDPFDILAFFSILSNMIAYWSRNGKLIRLTALCFSSPCWIIYSFHIASISSITCEIFVMSSIVLSVFRHGWKELDQKS